MRCHNSVIKWVAKEIKFQVFLFIFKWYYVFIQFCPLRVATLVYGTTLRGGNEIRIPRGAACEQVSNLLGYFNYNVTTPFRIETVLSFPLAF